MRFFVLIALICTGSFFAFRSHASIEYERLTLENGLRVIIIPQHRVPVVSFQVWYNAGARDELDGKSGAAHFLEHMMFKETTNLAPGDFTALMASYGAETNAYTSQDLTVYHQTLPKKYLPLAIWLEAERMRNITFNADDIETERKVVLEEYGTRISNQPSTQLYNKMKATLYNEHPYATPVIGFKEEIKALSEADLREFYDLFYSPNNAILVIAGDITLNEVENEIRDAFGNIQISSTSAHATPLSAAPKKNATSVTHESAQAKRPEWSRMYLVPSATGDSEDITIPLLILSEILGGSQTSMLFKELVIESDLSTKASSFYDDFSKDTTHFGVYVSPKSTDDIDTIKRTVDTLLQNLAHEPVTDQQLDRIKTQFKAEVIYAQDNIEHMARFFGDVVQLKLPITYITEWDSQIDDITAEDVIRAAKFLQEQPYVDGLLKPKTTEPEEDAS